MPRLDDVFDMYTRMLFVMGIVFQMPTLVFFLAKMGLVTARFLASQFKYAVLVIFIIAAVVTPSGDPYNQTILALPMIGLYILSIFIAWIFARHAKRGRVSPQAAEELSSSSADRSSLESTLQASGSWIRTFAGARYNCICGLPERREMRETRPGVRQR